MSNISDSKTTANIGTIYEALCRRITRCVLENDSSLLKKVKSVIAHNLIATEELSNELNLFNTITENTFQDRSVAKSFLNECIAHAKQIDQKKLNAQLKELLESASKVTNAEDIRSSSSELFTVLSEVFSYARSKTHKIEETTNYYKNIDYLLNYLTTERKDPTILPERKFPKMDRVVYECAVDRFNKKYASVLSESQKEIIHDFLMYRSTDRFKKSLLKRVKNIGESLSVIKKQNKSIDVESLQKKIKEYYDYASTSKTESVNNLMLNVCEMAELYDDIKKLGNGDQTR